MDNKKYMSLNDAEKKLEDNWKSYLLCSFLNFDSRYAAIIRKDNSNDKYAIEIGFKGRKPEIIKNNKIVKSWDDKTNRISMIDEYQEYLDQEGIQLEYIGVEDIEFKHDRIYDKCEHFYPNLTGGISIYRKNDPLGSGTAGAFFSINEDSDNSFYMLTNHHVVNNVGTQVVHPSERFKDDSKVIGEVIWSKFYDLSKFDNLLDAAVVKINCDSTIDEKRYTRCNKLKFCKIDDAQIDSKVYYCSYRSGLKQRTIKSTNCIVNMGTASKKIIFRDQILLSGISKNGDSGSVIVDENNNIVGLLMGGSKLSITVANKINNVFNLLRKEYSQNFTFKEFV